MGLLKQARAVFDSLLATRKEIDEKTFIHENHSKAEFPNEYRLNIESSLGCIAFMGVLLFLNLLIYIVWLAGN